ncbi:MAG: phage minor head protein [Bacteroidota bacterium]
MAGSPGIDPKTIQKLLERIYTGNRDLDRQLFRETALGLIGGVQEGFGKQLPKLKYSSPDAQLLRELQFNTGTFAAFKNHSQIRESVKLLKDENGNLRSKKDFIEKARKLNQTYNERYLGVEYDQAVSSSRQARRWNEAVRTRNLYPNLRYVAVMDDRTRPLHRKWHGIVLPINHKFWNTHYPPNDWACRCTTQRTDKPVDDKGLEVDNMPALPRQFNLNVGKEGKVFDDSHPYFKTPRFKAVAEWAKLALINMQRLEIRSHLKAEKISKKRFTSQLGTVMVSSSGAKELLNTPSDNLYLKNSLLYDLRTVLAEASYVKTVSDIKDNPMVKQYHYLFLEVDDKRFYLNVREMVDGSLYLYAITDKLR